MAGFRQDSLEEMARIRERVQALFDEILLRSGVPGPDATGGSGSLAGGWSPTVDVLETDDAFLLHAEVPGVSRDDVDLTVEGRRLELSGRRRPLPKDRNFARMERSYGRFRRAFELPAAIDADRIRAALDHGVLRVTLPKREPRRTVEARDGAARSGGGS